MKTILDIIEENNDCLTDRDVEFIKLINEDKNFIDIATKKSLTITRIKQIINKAMRRLPYELENINDRIIWLRKKEIELAQREKYIIEKEDELKIKKEDSLTYHEDFYLSINEFCEVKTSVRLRNILYRICNSMADLCDKLKEDRLLFLRTKNSGMKSTQELHDILSKYGIYIDLSSRQIKNHNK